MKKTKVAVYFRCSTDKQDKSIADQRAVIEAYGSSNAMEITVKRDATTGEPYTSEVSPPSGSFFTDIPNDQLEQAGYCSNEYHCQWMKENDPWFCAAHYSWEIIFQRTY